MTSAARPKRAAEEFARSHHHHHDGDDNTLSKKPRFDSRNPSTLAADAPEDDIILDADVIGKSGTQTKRNAVNIDGYESDSENENFEARARARARERGRNLKDEDEDEDEDMFAEEKEGKEEEEEGKKEVKFLDPSQIEGQVMESLSGGRVSGDILVGGKGKKWKQEETESESSGDEEERDQLPAEIEEEDAQELGAGSKKRHAPRLDAFNLKEEEEEGRYDESGNFVRKAVDPEAVNDNWLDGLSKKDMKRAKEAQEKREEERRRKAMEDDAVLTSDLLSTLVSQLETGETPLEALQRLNKGGKTEKKVPKWKQKKKMQQKDHKMDVDEPAAAATATATVNGNGHADPKEDARRKAVDAITGAADALYSRGQHEIYEAERELLMRQYKRETGEEWKSSQGNGFSSAESAFFYRWSDSRERHGPYDAHTMKAWNDAGYFGEGVEFQRVGDDDDEWSRLLDVTS
ncbi:hypothetical protein AC578_1683 [Pseudocercospora eumusae]|uniref:GYF domain-containing protein n=1 Tax=Pseudocercospora eumusae TaxID=321146 RepID=A0A139GWZ4_9PEZI|nr:hypothetical protein AC578_1683 [Pseudocercospora eumusae]